jgi:hypothetical protein
MLPQWIWHGNWGEVMLELAQTKLGFVHISNICIDWFISNFGIRIFVTKVYMSTVILDVPVRTI